MVKNKRILAIVTMVSVIAVVCLVLSNFQSAKDAVAAKPLEQKEESSEDAAKPFEQMTVEENYKSNENGEFGGVSTVAENSVQILAKEKNGVSGFMLDKNAIGKILESGVNQMTFTLEPSAYNSGSVPQYVVLDSLAPIDYVVNHETTVAKIDGNKLYFAAGTEITLRLEKLYADITAENGLNFVLLNGDSWENGGTTAYLVLKNLTFAEKLQKLNLDLVTTNGDFSKVYENEGSWSQRTEKAIRAVAEAGFKHVDLSLYHVRSAAGKNGDLMQDGWKEVVADLKALAKELGVEFRQAHSPGYTEFGSEEWIATNKRCIEVCSMLGIENLVVHAMPCSSKEIFYTLNLQFYEAILPHAEQYGVNILCENSTYKNGGRWHINDGADMREFIKYVQAQGYSNFHGCWDIGHAHVEGDQYLDMIALGDEMYAIHFADNMGDKDSHLLPYYGNLDVDKVMRALKVIGFDGCFTLETEGTPRITDKYTGPELEDGLNPYSTDRFEQEKIAYQIATYILEKYDCAAPDAHNLNNPNHIYIWIGVTAAVLIAASVVGVIVIKKKKNK